MKLTTEERAKLIAALASAEDEVLLNAVADHKHRTLEAQRLWDSLRGFIGAKPAPAPAAAAVTTAHIEAAAEAAEPPRAAQEPPGEACTRIGNKNRDEILACCMKRKTLDEVAKFIKKRPDGALPLLKLLWERGLLAYDGEHYATVK